MCVQAAKMLKKMLIVILMTIAFTQESLTQHCTRGDIRLVHGSTLSRGIVEICINSRWGRVCGNGWEDNDAAVVCRQLSYGSEGANRTFWTGGGSVPIFLDNVNCRSNEETLLNCSHLMIERDARGYHCNSYYSGFPFAGVNCSEEWLRVQNVSAATVNSSNHTVMISWKLYSNAPHKPSSLRVRCYNQRAIEFNLLVYNETLTHVSVGGVLSSVSFVCCVSVVYYMIYYGYYEAERRCASTDPEMLFPDVYTTSAPNQTPNQPFTTPSSTQMMSASIGSEKVIGSDLNMRASIVGGVLGSIIIILLLLLAMCGGALLFLLRSRSITKKSSTEMAVKRNVSYLTTALTASGEIQATDTVDHTLGAATEYSRIGPSYETIANSNHSRRPQQPVAGVSAARLSERYEFSEPHLAAMISAGRSGGRQGNEAAAAMDYEVPLQSGQHEEYSHLQH